MFLTEMPKTVHKSLTVGKWLCQCYHFFYLHLL